MQRESGNRVRVTKSQTWSDVRLACTFLTGAWEEVEIEAEEEAEEEAEAEL